MSMFERKPGGTETGEVVNYNDRNIEMFKRRLAIQARIEEIEAEFEAKPRRRSKKAEEERRELIRLRRRLDDITTEIIQFNWGLVRSYVKKFTSNTSREDSADFEAAAVVGLMRAIDTFNPEMGRFSSWAFKPIQREVLRSVWSADFSWLNPGDFERRPDILEAQRRLQAGDEDKKPAYEDIASEAGVTIEQVKRVLDSSEHDSLHRPVGDEGDAVLGDLIESSDADIEDHVLTKMTLQALEQYGLASLDARELFVISRRFGLDCEPEQKLAGIGEMLGLSREAVRQIEAKALAKIQHPVNLRKLQRQGRK
jgi:RNA polymerase sigma factor (sigma-70 family)